VVVTDRTVLHPQGGGQPSDLGSICSLDGGITFEVIFVRKMSRDAKYIEQLGHFKDDQKFSVGDKVDINVDPEKRKLHARIHSGGHLLDAAFNNLGWNQLIPTKGYHFPEGAYVEYEGEIAADKRESVIQQLNAESEKLIESASDVIVTANAGERIVTICGVSCPCGGTHVKNVSLIQSLRVTRIKKSKKSVRVSYNVDG
jgi:Ser-tRNA(Ala) deacylase AlaX